MKRNAFRKCLVFCLCLLLSQAILQAQSTLSREVTVHYTELTLIEMLIDMEKQTGVSFYYDPDVLPYYKLSFDFGTLTLFEALNRMLSNNNVTFLSKGEDGIIICRRANINRNYLEKVIKKVDAGQMQMPDFLLPYRVEVSIGSVQPQETAANIEVIFVDKTSREPLIGVSTIIDSLQMQKASNTLGACNWNLKPGIYACKGRLLGYRDLELTMQVNGSGSVQVEMEQRLQNLQEVVIQGATQNNKVKNNSTGVEVLTSKEMKALPSLAGEADVIKSLAILPGVSSAGEGTAGFSVRGGNIDQNLVLQGNIPLLNTSHVLGFFSIFNPDLVSNLTLYKGDIPARYGGRLSSVLDVELKNPDFSQWHGSVSAGMISAKVMAEGPIVRNKAAVLFGFRSSYSDWLLRRASLPDVRNSSGSFSDGTMKLSMRLSSRTSANVEAIYATDYFRYGQSFGYTWSTSGAGATLLHAFSEHLFFESNYAVSNLVNTYFDQAPTISFELDGGILLQKGHAHLKYRLNDRLRFMTGLQWLKSNSKEQSLRPLDNTSVVAGKSVSGTSGREQAIFAEGDLKWSDKLQLKVGLRSVLYAQLGSGRRFVYDPDLPRNTEAILDTIEYKNGETMARFGSLEPRLSLAYQLREHQSVKFSYNRIKQFTHLISNTLGATPADVWQPATAEMGPQTGDNFSLGWARDWPGTKSDLNIEAFYKWAKDVPTYQDFAQLLLNDHLETEILPGNLKTYGLEIALRKQSGRLNGWFSYTYSRVWQRAQSPFLEKTINEGAWFRGLIDQPHQLSVFGKWFFNPAKYFTASFTYRTGKPFSAPRSGYTWENLVIPYFDIRNNLRIPDYHRLDLGYTYDQSQSKIKGLRWILQASIYNVYARENPLSIFFRRNQNGAPRAYQFSPIGAAIPSLQLTFIL